MSKRWINGPWYSPTRKSETNFCATFSVMTGLLRRRCWPRSNSARASCEQSREFIRQLHGLKEHSEAVRKVPLASTVSHHVIRESEYFLNALETLNSAGALERFMDVEMPVQSMTLHEASSPPPSRSEADLSIQGMGDSGKAVPIGGHRLPPPYAYNALEPHIDEKTMRIHHDIHHQSYVDGLNKAEKTGGGQKSGDFELVKHWERELAFHGAGHYLHTIFWDIMNPQGGGEPGGSLPSRSRRISEASIALKALLGSGRQSGRRRLGDPRLESATIDWKFYKPRSIRTSPSGTSYLFWHWMYGSTPTTSNIKVNARITSRIGGTWSTGRRLRSVSSMPVS